jgi:tRNA modification GTPase
MDKLEKQLKDMFFAGQISVNDHVFVTNVRHKDALIRAKASLNEVINTINIGMPEDCMSIDLLKAYEILGEITGQSVGEDLIDRIFSEFCLGK